MSQNADQEWDERRLCERGSCIGVLDASGVCKVCGKPEELAKAPLRTAPEVVAAVIGSATASDDGDDRELCPDGGCIGVIGPDGRCKVCHRERSA